MNNTILTFILKFASILHFQFKHNSLKLMYFNFLVNMYMQVDCGGHIYDNNQVIG